MSTVEVEGRKVEVYIIISRALYKFIKGLFRHKLTNYLTVTGDEKKITRK